MAQGILVDSNYCTGCKSCIIACQMEHGYTEKQYGVTVYRLGPVQISDTKWEYDFFPQFTDWCDACAERVGTFGKVPSCVQHCQAHCLEFGEVEELAKKAARSKQYVVALG